MQNLKRLKVKGFDTNLRVMTTTFNLENLLRDMFGITYAIIMSLNVQGTLKHRLSVNGL